MTQLFKKIESILIWESTAYPSSSRKSSRVSLKSIGISAQMDTALLILFNFIIEAIMVLLLYPLFVQSWNKLGTGRRQFYRLHHRFFTFENTGYHSFLHPHCHHTVGLPDRSF